MSLDEAYLLAKRRKARGIPSYFDEDEEEDLLDNTEDSYKDEKEQNDEVDPLDAFMVDIDAQVTQQANTISSIAKVHTATKNSDITSKSDFCIVYVASGFG